MSWLWWITDGKGRESKAHLFIERGLKAVPFGVTKCGRRVYPFPGTDFAEDDQRGRCGRCTELEARYDRGRH